MTSFNVTLSSGSNNSTLIEVGESGYAEYSSNAVPAGIYTLTAIATNRLGATTTKSITFTVAPDPLDAPFVAAWNGMNDALKTGDKAKALTYLTVNGQIKYGPVFDSLMLHMADIIASYSGLAGITVADGYAEYAVSRNVNGVNQIFLISFLRDENGVWCIESM